MKTKFYILFLLCWCAVVKAQTSASQNNNRLIYTLTEKTGESSAELKSQPNNLQPVYFSYRKRKLLHQGYPMRGEAFVAMCRNIPDSLIQEQIGYYDELCRNKKNILLGTAFCGATAFITIMVASAGVSSSGFFGGVAAASAVSAGITAIASSGPHAKRKIIMFYNLPIAYNHYVNSLN